MKTTPLRILFILAILVGLAAAPGAQTFVWEHGTHHDTQARIRTAIRNATRAADGVTLSIADGYNAELETPTVNGGLRIDFPITVQGQLTSRHGIQTTVGPGGPLIRARTTNGGVRIERR